MNGTLRLVVLAVALAAAGCTRPRRGGLLPMAPTPAGRTVTTIPAAPDAAFATQSGAAAAAPSPTVDAAPHLQIDMPAAGARLTSPVRVSGVVQHEDGLLYVAQVVVRGAKPEQRGNARLTLRETGAFSIDVPYTLDAPAEGTVEVSAVDPVSGTVAETVRVTVQLAAAR